MSTALIQFIDRYGPRVGPEGPVRLIHEVFAADPDDWQVAGLRYYGGGGRQMAIESCHGPGKTCLLAWLIWAQQLTRFPQKTACTAPASGQMDDALLPEVKMWYTRLPETIRELFEVRTDRIMLRMAPNESFASFRTARPEQPDALQGVHAPWVMLVADEGDGVAGPIFEAALGSMSGERAITVLAGNPVRTGGFFYNANHGENASNWFRIHVSGIAGDHCGPLQPDGQGSYVSKRVSPSFVELVANEYGAESNAYRVRVLGRPPRSEADAIIPFEFIESARNRDVQPNPLAPIVWGLDVARAKTGDLNALAKRRQNILLDIKTWPGQNDVMPVVGAVKAEWDLTPSLDRPVDIMVDAIGLGAGVADRLRELKLPARAINVNESSALNASRFKNLRTELAFSARDWFARLDCRMVPDKMFEQEAAAQKYKVLESSGKVLALPKDDMRKHLHPSRSPDRLDAFLLTFASGAASARFGSSGNWTAPLRRNLKSIV